MSRLPRPKPRNKARRRSTAKAPPSPRRGIPPESLKRVEAIVRAAYPQVTFCQLVVDCGPGTVPEVVPVLGLPEAQP